MNVSIFNKGVLLAVFLFLLTSLSAQSRIFVSPNGNDHNSGRLSAPLFTIQKAVELAKKQNGNVLIVLKAGRYAVRNTITITGGNWNSLIIAAEHGAEVSISGDQLIPLKKIQKITSKQIQERLQKQVVDSIRVIDFKELNIPVSNLHATGFGRPSIPAWNELFINGKPLQLSRWPNDTMALIGAIEIAGDDKDKAGGRLPVFHYNESRPQKWLLSNNIWISGYFGHGYADDLIPVKKIDTTNQTIQTGMFTTYQFMTGASFRRWFAVNLIEEIDKPGEYAIDFNQQKIYFYPPQYVINKVQLSVMEQPLISIVNCSNVQIKNIVIENSRGMGIYMQNTENVIVDSCTLRNLGNVAVSMGMGTLAGRVDLFHHSMETGGDSIAGLLGDVQGRIYVDPVFDRHAGKNNGVRNCYIYNVGAGGISLGGGNRKTLVNSNNFVENCRIQFYNRIEKSYRPAVWIDGTGNRISNCDISDAPSMAVLFHGNNHVIEYCRITNVCTEVDDQGAIYYGRDPSEQGNIIRYNYFKDLSPRHRVTATYHDDGACGSEVYGNIYFRAGSLPVLIGGGSDHHYYNNIFIESPVAIHIDNRLQNWAANMAKSAGLFEQRLNAVKYQQPPYSEAYPQLVNYFNDNPGFPKRNRIERNLFYKIQTVLNGQTQWGEFWNNWITNENPGFTDKNDPLKGFRKDAAVFKKIANFQAIPVEKIGCVLPGLNIQY